MARSREKTVAQTVIALPHALATAALDTMTPAQRAKLNPLQAAAINHVAAIAARAIGQVLEQPNPKLAFSIDVEVPANG